MKQRIENLIKTESENLPNRLPFLIGKVPNLSGEGRFTWDAAITKVDSIKKVGDISLTKLKNNRIKLSLSILVEKIEASGENFVKVGFIKSTKDLQVSLAKIQFDTTLTIDLKKYLITVEELKVTQLSGLVVKRGFAGWLVSVFLRGFLTSNYLQNEINQFIDKHIPIVENLKPKMFAKLLLNS